MAGWKGLERMLTETGDEMKTPKNGGPAFPVVEHDAQLGTRACPGLTMLDWFAGQVLAGSVGNWCSISPASGAEYCYDMAAAMLEEKRKRDAKAPGEE